MRRALLAAAALPLAGLLGVGTARAQMDSREAIALQNQILELRRDLQAVQAQRGGGGYAAPAPVMRGSSDMTAQLLDRVQALEEEVRRLRGQLDEQANASRRAQDDLAKQIGDLSFRLQQGGAQGSAPAAAPPAAAPQAAPRRTPEMAMQEGNAALARRDYAMAEAAAREVLAGKGPQATAAQFLLAQSLAGKRDFAGAAVAYDDAYRRAPRGPRASDALLGLASTLLALNDKAAACQALNTQRTQFPGRAGDGAALRARAGC